MITIKDIDKKFGRLQVLKQVNLNLKQSQCVALIGPNGCGKTTLIKSILGMVLPEGGEILFEGKSIKSDIDYRRHIGYMPQIGRYPENMSIGQVIDMIRQIRGKDSDYDNDLFEAFEINRLLDKKMRTLSGGTTQKVSAVLAFMFNPAVLILDEPTAGLDPLAAEILKQKIIQEREKGKLILITSHLLSELEELITEVVFMQEGEMIFHKSVEELKEFTSSPTISNAIIQVLKSA